MIRARREAMAWMRAADQHAASWWTYLRRYPNGMYAYDAERRACATLSAPFAAPPGFAMVEFDDVPMALIDERHLSTARCIGSDRVRRAHSLCRGNPATSSRRYRALAVARRQRDGTDVMAGAAMDVATGAMDVQAVAKRRRRAAGDGGSPPRAGSG